VIAPDIHIHPRRDLIAHTLTDDCACGPRAELVGEMDTGVTWWLIRHHALDGRDRRAHTADEKAGPLERAVRRTVRKLFGRGWHVTIT